jgi:hypothetical protein
MGESLGLRATFSGAKLRSHKHGPKQERMKRIEPVEKGDLITWLMTIE